MSLPGTLTCTTPSKGFTLNSEGTMVAYQMCFTKISTLRWCSWLCWWWWCLWGKCTFNILLWKTWMAGWANKLEIHSQKMKDISGNWALGCIFWYLTLSFFYRCVCNVILEIIQASRPLGSEQYWLGHILPDDKFLMFKNLIIGLGKFQDPK